MKCKDTNRFFSEHVIWIKKDPKDPVFDDRLVNSFLAAFYKKLYHNEERQKRRCVCDAFSESLNELIENGIIFPKFKKNFNLLTQDDICICNEIPLQPGLPQN